MIAERCGIAQANVKVKNLAEEKEHELNHANDKRSGKALIGTEPESSDNQNLAGEEYKMNFLKELGKNKTQGTQVKGVNDEILASGTPKHVKEKPGKQVETKTKFQNIFTKQVKVPSVKGVK